jgi:acetyltransferase-like isoleucine patch superfamily enzyme
MRKKMRPFIKLLLRKSRILFYRLLSDNVPEGDPLFYQPVLMEGPGKVIFGRGVKFGVVSSPAFYNGYSYINARTKDATIRVGDNVWMNNNVTIVSEGAGIVIGNDCLFGNNVTILDSDFHHVDPQSRFKPLAPTRRVKIGNNVWIGSNVTILKGTLIEDNAVIAAGSLVSGKVKKNTIMGGNPAQFLRKIQ